jgi:hypothetical protein
MPIVEAELADGTILEFPEGTADDVIDRAVQEHLASNLSAPDQELALRNNQMLSGMLQRDVQEHPEPQPFTPKPEEESFWDRYGKMQAEASEADVAAQEQIGTQLGLGMVSPLRMVASAAGADSVAARKLSEAEQYLQGMLSASDKQDMEEAQKIRQEAQDKGIWDQVVAEWGAIKADPQSLVRFGAGAVPFMAAAIAGPGVASVTGLTAGVGGVKESIFESVRSEVAQKLIKEGVDEKTAIDRATEIADKAQAYNGENLDSIVAGGILGLATAGKAGEITDSVIQGVAEKGLLRAGAESAVTLGATSAQAKEAENLALRREGFDVPQFRGVPGAFAQGAIPGAGLGLLHGAQPGRPDMFESYKESTGFRPEDYRAEPAVTPEEPRQLRGPTDESARTDTGIQPPGVDDTGAGARLPIPSEEGTQEGLAGQTEITPRGGMGVPGGDLGPTGGTEGREPSALEEVRKARAEKQKLQEQKPLASISSESTRNDLIRTLTDIAPVQNAPKTTLRTQVKEVNDAIAGAIARGENIGTVINKGIQLQNSLAKRSTEQKIKKLAYEASPERGEEIVREKLLGAVRRGEVTKEQYALLDWALRQNPSLASDLAISVRSPKGAEVGAGGQYNPSANLMEIFKKAGNKYTQAHELLHHAERMLPEDLRDQNRKEWLSALKSLHDMAQDIGDQKIIRFVENVLTANTAEGPRASDAHEQLVEDFKTGKIKADELYHYLDPSEYWAVKGSKLLSDKAAAGESWAKRSLQWLKEFLEHIKKAFGLDNQAAIVKGINEILNKKKTTGKISGEMLKSQELPETSFSVSGKGTPKTKKTKLDATERKIVTSEDVFDKNVGVGDLVLEAKDFKDRLKVLKAWLDAGDVVRIKALLPTMPTDQIIRWIGDKIPQLEEVGTLKMNMDSARLKRVQRNTEVLEKLVKFASIDTHKLATMDFLGLRELASMMHTATLRNVDPTLHTNLQQALLGDEELVDLRAELAKATPAKAPSVKRQITMRENSLTKAYGAWNQLGLIKGGRELFKEVKDIYEKDHNDYVKALYDIAENSALPGSAKDPTSEKGKLMAAVRMRFVASKKIPVYFPLSHVGKYWVRIGKGAAGQTTMFNTATARNRYVDKYVESSGKTKTELMRSEAIDFGDDVRSLRTADKSITSDKLLTEIFDLLDKNAKTAGQAVSTSVDVEDIKDAVFQLFFRGLPGGDIRSRYTKRKGKAGFSADVIQSFALLTNTAAGQLSRLKYEGPIKRKLEEAYSHINSDPNKLTLTPFIDEIAKKIDVELGGNKSLSSIENQIVSWGSKLVFYSFLTKPKQFLVQLTQLPIVGYPTLMRDYGAKNATAISIRYMDLYHKLGVTEDADNIDPDTGKRVSPIRPFTDSPKDFIKDFYLSNVSLGNSQYVNDRVLLKHTFNWADEQLNMFSNTNTVDISGRSTTPTKVNEGVLSKGTRNMLNFMGAAIHHGERFSREFMFMSAFELAFEDELKKRSLPSYKEYVKANYVPLELRKALEELDQIEDAFDIEKGSANRKAQSPLAQAIEKARIRATKSTYDALFNYSPYNKPRLMTGMGVLPALGTKLMMYPISMSHVLGVNAFRIIPKYREFGEVEYKRQFKAAKEEGLNDTDADTRAKAKTAQEKEKIRKQRRDAAMQLFGVEGMQSLFGGLQGSALVIAMLGVLDVLKNAFVDDDEIDPTEQDDIRNPLSKKMDTYDWFINYGIPEIFGTPEDPFAEQPGWRNAVSRSLTEGVISKGTGVNIGASTGFNTLFFVDGSKADRSQDSVKLWLFDHSFGAPAAAATGLTTAWSTGWENGEWGRALEKSPWLFGTAAKAFRHATEGEVTPSGIKMQDKDWFNLGRAMVDTAGFGHTDIAEMQRQTQLYFKYKPEADAARAKVFDAYNKAVIWKEKNIDKIRNPETKDEAIAKFRDMVKAAQEEDRKYAKSPYGRLSPIESDAIDKSLEEKATSRVEIPIKQREFLGMPPKKKSP